MELVCIRYVPVDDSGRMDDDDLDLEPGMRWGRGGVRERIKLVPIDHGCSIPDTFEVSYPLCTPTRCHFLTHDGGGGGCVTGGVV